MFLFSPLVIWGNNLDTKKIDGQYSFSGSSHINTLKIIHKNKIPFGEISTSHSSGCLGEVSSELKILSNKNLLLDKNDSEGKCLLEIIILKNKIQVKEKSCLDFHGSSCDFNMMVKK
jgi:hypothetical protein